MKANEAPEKIYMNWVNYPLEEMQVEYTRTDAFIEKACSAYCNTCGNSRCSGIGCAKLNTFKGILKIINSLEVKDVDLEKEIKETQRNYKTIEEYEGYPCTMYANDIKWIAKHFFELGLKAQKGE